MADSVNTPPSSAFAYIQTATEQELRMVLTGLCADEQANKRIVEIFKHLEKTSKPSEGDEQRRTPLYKCGNCKKTYSEAQNAPDACHYHPGIVDINYGSETWAGRDDAHIFDDEGMREEIPEGFMWICCNGALDSGGCMVGSHRQGDAVVSLSTTSPLLSTDEKRGNKRPREP